MIENSRPVTAELADGQILNFPPGTPDSVVQETVKRLSTEKQEQTVGGEALALGETALTVGSSIAGDVAGGAAGISTMIYEGLKAGLGGEFDLGNVDENIKWFQNKLRVDPKTERGKETVEALGNALHQTFNTIEAGIGGAYELARGRGISQAASTITDIRERGAGDVVMDRTGSPLLSTIADVGTEAAAIAAPAASIVGRIAKGEKFVRPGQPRPVEQTAPAAEAQPATTATSEFLPEGARPPTTPPSGRTKLTGSEKDFLDALAKDSHPQTTLKEVFSPKERKRIRLDGIKEADTVRVALEESGLNPIMMDIGGAHVRSKGAGVAAIDRAGQALGETSIKRGGQVRQQMFDVLEDTHFKGRNYEDTVSGIETRARTNSNTLYGEAHAQPVTITPALAEFLQEPLVRGGMQKAIKEIPKDTTMPMALRNEVVATIEAALGSPAKGKPTLASGKPNPNYIPARPPDPSGLNMFTLDMIKRGMDKSYETLSIKNRRTSVARDLAIAKSTYRDMLVDLNPKYGKALETWSTDMSAKEAAMMGRQAVKDIRGSKRSVEEVVRESDSLTPYQRELYNIGIADQVKSNLLRVPDTARGTVPSSVTTQFGGSPAFRMLMERVLHPDDLAKMDRLVASQEVIGGTTDALKAGLSDAGKRQAFEARSFGRLPEFALETGTNVLFVSQGANRFAALQLIALPFTKPRMFAEIFRAPETAKLMLGKAAKNNTAEIIEILEYQLSKPSVMQKIGGQIKVPKRLKQAAQLSPEAFLKWLSVKKNRLELYKYAGIAAMIEETLVEEDGRKLKPGSANAGVTEQLNLGTQ